MSTPERPDQACAVPIEEQAAGLRTHYDEVSTAASHWSNQIPVAINLWEKWKKGLLVEVAERPDRGDTPRERRRERPRGERDPDVRHAAEAAASGRVWNRSRTDRRRSPEDVRGADVGEARELLLDMLSDVCTNVHIHDYGALPEGIDLSKHADRILAALRSPEPSGERAPVKVPPHTPGWKVPDPVPDGWPAPEPPRLSPNEPVTEAHPLHSPKDVAELEAKRDQIVNWLTRRAQWYRMIEAGGGGQLTPEIAGSDAEAFEETVRFVGDYFSTAETVAVFKVTGDHAHDAGFRILLGGELPIGEYSIYQASRQNSAAEPRYTLDEAMDALHYAQDADKRFDSRSLSDIFAARLRSGGATTDTGEATSDDQ
jgi:hypothetical protein